MNSGARFLETICMVASKISNGFLKNIHGFWKKKHDFRKSMHDKCKNINDFLENMHDFWEICMISGKMMHDA